MGIIENRDAQFMLLAGFIIAIGLVITAVMLNNIIFVGNMASGAGTDPAKYNIVNLMQITADEMKSAYRNAGGTEENFSKQMQHFKGNLSKIYSLHGEAVNVSWNASNWDNNLYANFTEDGTTNGAPNWILIENVNNSNITVNITVTTGTFSINITNTTHHWQIDFIDPVNQIINNSQIMANITSPYTISFINGTNASGNYSIAGNTTYGRNFIHARDYILYATITFSTSRMHANITIPVSVPR